MWTGLLLWNPHATADRDGYYTDHLRHGTCAWLAARVGYRIYTEPYGALLDEVHPPVAHRHWTDHAYLYPPGALLLFLPAGVAENGLHLRTGPIYLAVVWLLVLAAHAAFLIFLGEIRRFGPWATGLAGPLVYLELLHWSLNGFYDPVFVLLGLLSVRSLREGRPERAFLLFGLALFVHYRALYLGLVGLVALAEVLPRLRAERALRAPVVVGLVLIAIAVTTLVAGVSHSGAIPNSNRLALDRAGPTPRMLAVFLLTATLAVVLWRRRQLLAAATLALCFAVLLMTRQTQSWHVLAFVPVLVLPGTWPREPEPSDAARLASALLLLWVLLTYTPFFREWPGLEWVVQVAKQLA